MSLNLKAELDSQKAVVAAILTQLSSDQSKEVNRLQMENERINGHLQSLLNKLKVLTKMLKMWMIHMVLFLFFLIVSLLTARILYDLALIFYKCLS